MEDAYIIHGGKPIRGTVQLSGAKNIALKVLIAALLFEGTVTLKNIPRIQDVMELIYLLESLGVAITFEKGGTVTINSSHLKNENVDFLQASKLRVSFLLFAPLLYRFSVASLPNPGGCRIGARSIDRVIEGLKALGITIAYDSQTGYYNAKMTSTPSGSYTFVKPSHTATEMLVMMSVFGQGEIVIKNAAHEPEIDDLVAFLNTGGANITRKGDEIIIHGVKKLKQDKPFTIESDRVEAATYAALGIATDGDVTVGPINEVMIMPFIEQMQRIGAGVEKKENNYWRFYGQPLQAVSVETAPHPGFLTDWQPFLAVLLIKANGKSIIHERIFENRFSYVSELTKLGADIKFVDYPITDPKSHYYFNYDPAKKYEQTIEIIGPQKLHNGVVTVSDLRAGATLVIAALVSSGQSYVRGINHIERGYEKFEEKILSLGGEISKV